MLLKTRKQLITELRQCVGVLHDARTERTTAENEIASLRLELDNMRRFAAEQTKKLKTAEGRISAIQPTIADLRYKLQLNRAEVIHLEAAEATLAEAHVKVCAENTKLREDWAQLNEQRGNQSLCLEGLHDLNERVGKLEAQHTWDKDDDAWDFHTLGAGG